MTNESTLDWACGSCGHRQAVSGACAACRHPETLDLDRSETRAFLHQREEERQTRREGRRSTFALLGAALIIGALWLVPGWSAWRGQVYPSLPLYLDQALLGLFLALVLAKVATLRDRALYPWLPALRLNKGDEVF